MPTTITNQARLTYLYGGETGSATSNLATAVIPDTIEATKTALETDYRADDEITYIITVVNNCCAGDITVTVTDDLGTFTPDGCPSPVTPLTYVGPANLYIDGTLSASLTVNDDEDDEVVFTLPAIESGSSAVIVYKAQVNEFAQLSEGSTIENTATIVATGNCAQTVEASLVLPVAEYADVSIIKSMSDSCGTCSGLTYTFDLSNSGNTEATGVTLTDTFDPIPAITSITVNGVPLTAADYTFTGGTLTLPAASGTATTITVPAAMITENCAGTTVVPGTTQIVVTGTLNGTGVPI